jgi:hypothetical protein
MPRRIDIMRVVFRLWLGFVAGLILCSGFVVTERSYGQLLPPDAGITWHRIRTEHFRVHYASGSDSLGYALARIAERTYHTFSDDLGLRPPGPVEVYLQESYDIVNSAAAPVLHRSIFIFPDPPYGAIHSGLGHHGDWLELAFVHEYAHIVDLERRSGLWRVFHILTHLGYPNLYRPLWTIEGFAVWAESRYTGGGRIGSPTMDMVIRADALAGRLRSPYEWSGSYVPWPNGLIPYLYGGAFMDHLAERYGDAAPVEYRGRTAASRAWSYAGSFPQLTQGRSFYVVLMDFYDSMKAKADESLAWIEQQGDLVEGEFLAKPGSAIFDILSVGDDGTLLIAYSSDRDQQEIVALDSQTLATRSIERVLGVEVRLSYDRSRRRVIYSDSDVEASSRLVSYLYTAGIDGGGQGRSSSVSRLHEPAFHPTEDLLVACRREGGRSRLVEVGCESARNVVTSLPAAANVFHPAWSPDGKHLVAAVWQPPGRQDIWLIDYRSGNARPLTDDEHWDVAPVFSSDGRFVLFSSDRTGVWNIYGLEVSSGRIFQVTNVTTGAFLPEVSGDGGWLYFIHYGRDGDEVRRLAFDSGSWREVPRENQPMLPAHKDYLARFRAARPARSREEARPGERPLAAYVPKRERSWLRSLRYLQPIAHIILPAADEKGFGIGLLLAGSDPLGATMYTGMVSYGFRSRRTSYYALYQSYALPRLRIDISAQDMVAPTGIEYPPLEDEYWWKREEAYDFAVALPWIELARHTELRAGMNFRTSTAVLADESEEASPEPGFFTGRTTEAYGGIVFSNAKLYPLSFSPEDGLSISAFYRNWHKKLGGEFSGTGGDVDLRAYKKIGDDIVVAARLAGMRRLDGDIQYGMYSRVAPAGQDSTFVTSRAGLGSVEARFRIAETQTNLIWDWIFVNRLHGALFYDLGYYYDEGRCSPDSIGNGGTDGGLEGKSSWEHSYSLGARFSVDTTLGFMLPLTFDFIIAVPSLGEPKVYMGVMTAF